MLNQIETDASTRRFQRKCYFQQTLKEAIPVKTAEDRSVAALRKLLERVPFVQVLSAVGHPSRAADAVDLVVELRVDGHAHRLICERVENGQPRYARTALLKLRYFLTQHSPDATAIFIAPYISPAVQQLCIENGVSYLDLEGNTYLAFRGVFIERHEPHQSVAETRGLKSLFKPKSGQVLRAMLREPSRVWRVAELSAHSGVSLGHVSNVRAGLLDRELARASNQGFALKDPDALLDTWRDSYTAPAGQKLRFHTILHGRAFEDAVRSALGVADPVGHAVLASYSAANWICPYARIGMNFFFADELGLRRLQSALKLTSTAKGENVIVTIPKDPSVLTDSIEPVPGAICTNLIQTYLDLSIGGERGAEAADFLRQERLSWAR